MHVSVPPDVVRCFKYLLLDIADTTRSSRHHPLCVCGTHVQVVQEAICPERRKGLDDQLSAVASITEVYVSGDLQVQTPPALGLRHGTNKLLCVRV